MVISLCSECLQEKPLTKFEGTVLCKDCRISYNTNKMISELFNGKKVVEMVIAKCNAKNCSKLIHNTDKPRKFLKVSGFEYFINSSESEEILLCEECYQKKITKQKKKEKIFKSKINILLVCAISSLILWFRLFRWGTISELWKKYPIEFSLFVIIIIIFSFISFYYLLYPYLKNGTRDLKKKRNNKK